MNRSSLQLTGFSFLLFFLLLFSGCGTTPAATSSIPTDYPPTTFISEPPLEPTLTPVTLTEAPTETPTPTSTPTPSPTPTPKCAEITFSFAGDVTLCSDLINQNSARNFFTVYERVQNDSYFFANVLPYFQEDDITLVNLEGTFSDGGTRKDKTYAFRAPTSYVNILTSGSIEAVSLGNNHSSDYGQESYEDTLTTLDDAGILHAKDADICYTTVKDTKIAMISIYYFPLGFDGSKAMIESTIKEAKEQNAALLIISFHWGVEGDTNVNSTQQALAHYAVDCGANVVIGHHPHVLQAIEKYNGAYIVYSLANFCFGGNTNPKDKDTMIFQQTFTLLEDELQLTDDVRIIPCSISSVESPNNYQPTPQTGEEAERIMGRINTYSQKFDLQFELSPDGTYVPAYSQ